MLVDAAVFRRRAAARLLPDAANEVARSVIFENRGNVVGVEPGLRDGDMGESGLGAHPGDEIHLADRVLRVPFRFEIDGLDDVMARRIGQVIGRIIGAADRRIIAVAKRDQRLVAEPGIVMLRRIPEVDVCIDHGKVGRHWPLHLPFVAPVGPLSIGRLSCPMLPSTGRFSDRYPGFRPRWIVSEVISENVLGNVYRSVNVWLADRRCQDIRSRRRQAPRARCADRSRAR